MNIYEISNVVRKELLATINPATTVQTHGWVGYSQGTLLKFKDKNEAIHLNGGEGYLFEYSYETGGLILTPFS